MLSDLDDFSSENISDIDMKNLADHIEKYLFLFEDIMIIPEEFKINEKDVQSAKKIIRKLIKKLRKGDRSVFKED
jgi:hypothetical protein